MRREEALVLDDGDREMVRTLVDLEVPRNQAKVLVYLAQVDEAVSPQIEQGADMRQPEVSVAMRELRRLGWVAKRDIRREGKGRPMHGYQMAVAFDEILDALEARIRQQARVALDQVDKLRGMQDRFGAETFS